MSREEVENSVLGKVMDDILQKALSETIPVVVREATDELEVAVTQQVATILQEVLVASPSTPAAAAIGEPREGALAPGTSPSQRGNTSAAEEAPVEIATSTSAAEEIPVDVPTSTASTEEQEQLETVIGEEEQPVEAIPGSSAVQLQLQVEDITPEMEMDRWENIRFRFIQVKRKILDRWENIRFRLIQVKRKILRMRSHMD